MGRPKAYRNCFRKKSFDPISNLLQYQEIRGKILLTSHVLTPKKFCGERQAGDITPVHALSAWIFCCLRTNT